MGYPRVLQHCAIFCDRKGTQRQEALWINGREQELSWKGARGWELLWKEWELLWNVAVAVVKGGGSREYKIQEVGS